MSCGVDIIEICRVENAIKKYGNNFLNRIFTKDEIVYCENKKKSKYKHFAVRFAAKEAVSKALSIGISRGIKWTDIEVTKDVNGVPAINLYNKALEISAELKIKKINISMSHCNTYAITIITIES